MKKDTRTILPLITFMLFFGAFCGFVGYKIGKEEPILEPLFEGRVDNTIDVIGTESANYWMSAETTTVAFYIDRHNELFIQANASGTESIVYQLDFSNDDDCASTTDTTISWFGDSGSSISSGEDTISATTTRTWTSPSAGVHGFKDPVSRDGEINTAKCMRLKLWNNKLATTTQNSASSTGIWVQLKKQN